ncbi:response regulator transcription factor [Streptococcus halotolerans]|uniref:response regulator transcription factor n=1 Tax=Streptococcus halotolerans TaxID=1814128 RepID=UPI000787A2C0|nr:LytTR family DNA-binding domain-containing protein [Streptococcus halotolerans]
MNIFILEDNVCQQERLLGTIKEILKEENLSTRHLAAYSKASNLLDNVKERGSHQLFFFDIEIKDEARKGLEVASELRQMDPNAVIVFVTTHSEFAPISFKYKVAAYDFIDKMLDPDDFKDQVRDSILYTASLSKGVQTEIEYFDYKSAKAQVKVPLHDILYFETSQTAHKLILRTKTERLEFYARLSDIEKMSDKFYQSHRSFLVNLDNVSGVDKTEQLVYFENGESCLVSRLKVKTLIAKWENNISGRKNDIS